ncbi:hypothetical protein ACFLW5_01985 [Chloroflexota bacterium]
MKISRIFTGSDNESHFEDIDIPLEIIRGVNRRSKLIKATGIIFREAGAEYNRDWHTAPQRQFIIHLEGETEMEVGDGTKRRFVPGDILLTEDTMGRGHISRAVNNEPREMIVVTLD